jgi:hypothetical protein
MAPVVVDADAPNVVLNLLRKSGEAGEWYRVELPDGRAGFLPKAAAEDYAAWKQGREATAATVLPNLFLELPAVVPLGRASERLVFRPHQLKHLSRGHAGGQNQSPRPSDTLCENC